MYQAIVLKNIRQLQAMIGDLLEVTRLETGIPAATDTLDTLQGTAGATGIAPSCHVPRDLAAGPLLENNK